MRQGAWVKAGSRSPSLMKTDGKERPRGARYATARRAAGSGGTERGKRGRGTCQLDVPQFRNCDVDYDSPTSRSRWARR